MSLNWSWSFSKSRSLQKCPRLFEYSLSNNNENNQFLINLRALAGVAIHSSIQVEMDKWSKGILVSPRESIERATEFVERIWNNRNDQIIEVINGFTPNESYLDVTKVNVTRKLQRFYCSLWPRFSKYKHLFHERLEKFVVGKFNVYVKVDLACKNSEGDLYIIDWKTGSSTIESNQKIQLATYTLWALLELKEDISSIRPTIVNLDTGRVTTFQPTVQDIDFVRNLIQDDYDLVKLYDKGSNYPTFPELAKCTSCSYLNLCEEGRSLMRTGKS